MLFNVVVDNVIRTWLAMTAEDHRVDHYGLVDTSGRYLRLFYANYGMVGSRDADWMQHSINFLFGLFRQYSLAANIAKSRTITCQPSALQSGMHEKATALKCTSVGNSYHVILQRRIP